MSDERHGLPSASASSTWGRCQGQPQLVRQLPPRNDGDAPINKSPESERGTRIHHALETRSTVELQDDGEIAAYNQAIQNETEAIEAWQRDMGIELSHEGERELRLGLWNERGQLICTGKADAHFIESGSRQPCVLIEDFKTLSGISAGAAAENEQLRTLAVMFRFEYGARHVRVLLNKPEAFGRQLDWCDYDTAALDTAEYMVRFHLWLTTLPNAPRTAGPHCNYCPCAGINCPENAARAMLPLAVTNGGILERVDTLSPADLKKLWDADTLIRKTLDRVSYRLSQLDDETLASIRLKRGKPKETEKIKDVAGAVERLRALGISDADILACASIGKEKLTAVVRREYALSSDDKAAQWIARELGEFIETTTGAAPLREIK